MALLQNKDESPPPVCFLPLRVSTPMWILFFLAGATFGPNSKQLVAAPHAPRFNMDHRKLPRMIFLGSFVEIFGFKIFPKS